MGFWPFGRKGEGVEVATRIVSAAPRDGVTVRGKLTLHFASRESKATADVIADQLASLVEAIVREADDKSQVVGKEAEVLGELEARLPSNMPATRSIEIAALHAVGDFGPRPSGEWNGLIPSSGGPDRPRSPAPSRPAGPPAGAAAMGAGSSRPPPPASKVGGAKAPSARPPADDELDFSLDSIPLDTSRRPLQSTTDGSPADGSTIDLHPGSSRTIDLDDAAPPPRSSVPAAAKPVQSAWPPTPPSSPPSRPQALDLIIDLDSTPEEDAARARPTGASSAPPPRVLPALDERPSQRLPTIDEHPSQRLPRQDEGASLRRAAIGAPIEERPFEPRPSERLPRHEDRPSQRLDARPASPGAPSSRDAIPAPRGSSAGRSARDERPSPPVPAAAPSSGGSRGSRASRPVAVGGVPPVGSSPEVIGGAVAGTLRDAASRLLLGALRAHDTLGVRGVSLDECGPDVLATFAPAADGRSGAFESTRAGEMTRWKNTFGADAFDRIRAETAVCSTFLAYATMLEADVPQNITLEVLQAACGAAFANVRSPLASIGRYMAPKEPSLAEELASQIGQVLGVTLDVAATGYALGPLMTSIEANLRASAKMVKDASGL